MGILGCIAACWLFTVEESEQPDAKPTLEEPSIALGQTIANAFHQALSDPYFIPLESLANFLNKNPDTDRISVDILTKWSPDMNLPNCFVYNMDRKRRSSNQSRWQLDKTANPWALESVSERLWQSVIDDRKKNQLAIATFIADEQKWWLGFFRIPIGSEEPDQFAGVFFSIDDYLQNQVPRLVDKVAKAARFPIAPFQQDEPIDRNMPDGYISMIILDDKGEVYLQRGRNFDPNTMIYSESKWYPHPIVCMQRDWDLQIFNSNYSAAPEKKERNFTPYIVFAISILLISVAFWLKKPTNSSGETT